MQGRSPFGSLRALSLPAFFPLRILTATSFTSAPVLGGWTATSLLARPSGSCPSRPLIALRPRSAEKQPLSVPAPLPRSLGAFALPGAPAQAPPGATATTGREAWASPLALSHNHHEVVSVAFGKAQVESWSLLLDRLFSFCDPVKTINEGFRFSFNQFKTSSNILKR